MSGKKEDAAWANQAASLIQVQVKGSGLEKQVRDLLCWPTGKVIYDQQRGYSLQVDAAWPNVQDPKVIASVTYSDPDTPGHSNENKLQLKVGEIALLKSRFPNVRIVLVLGGTRKAWLQYVLEAFTYFFDEVICLWDGDDAIRRLSELAASPEDGIEERQPSLWTQLRHEWQQVPLMADDFTPPCGLLRYQIADLLPAEFERGVRDPSDFHSEIARHCFLASQQYGGKEWGHFLERRWSSIEMSRNYFNPNEAATEISIQRGGFDYSGGVGRDIEVRSLLHQLGMTNTKMSEDFVLERPGGPEKVFIQCKASGGGRGQHGKNIQNRTKEQITRGLLYRCYVEEGQIRLGPKEYYWIGVVDGDWGVSKGQPLKYIHMLQLAGYDSIVGASELTGPDAQVLNGGNPLMELLEQLQCRRA